MDTVALNSGVATTVADSDLVTVCDSGGSLKPVSFANLMAAVKKSGSFRLDTQMSTHVLNGQWVRIARSIGNQFGGLLGICCSYDGNVPPKPAFIALGGYNATFGALDAHWINKNASIISAVRFIKDGNTCYVEAKFNGDKTLTFFVTLSNNANMVLVPAEVSTAANPVAEINWGGVIVRYSNTYNSVKKGGRHADGGDCGCAGECADGYVGFGSLDSACECIGRACEDGGDADSAELHDVYGFERCEGLEDLCSRHAGSDNRKHSGQGERNGLHKLRHHSGHPEGRRRRGDLFPDIRVGQRMESLEEGLLGGYDVTAGKEVAYADR